MRLPLRPRLPGRRTPLPRGRPRAAASGRRPSSWKPTTTWSSAAASCPYKVKGQEGKLRAVAVVVEKPGAGKVALVACDVLMLNRDVLDPAVEEVAAATRHPGVARPGQLHPHPPRPEHRHRPRLRARRAVLPPGPEAIVKAAKDANAEASADATFHFRLGEESSVGQNSRLLLKDDTIFWIGPRDDAVRPTGPFDPELPVLAFRGPDEQAAGGAVQPLDAHHRDPQAAAGRRPSTAWPRRSWRPNSAARSASSKGRPARRTTSALPAAEATVRIKAAVRRRAGEGDARGRWTGSRR